MDSNDTGNLLSDSWCLLYVNHSKLNYSFLSIEKTTFLLICMLLLDVLALVVVCRDWLEYTL